MNNVVWKYPVNIRGLTELNLPGGAQVLTTNLQNEQPFLWALVDLNKPLTIRHFKLVDTGEPFEANSTFYVGSIFPEGGRFVFHLFEV